ncbi:DNA polymerase ligase N-terminal domain-containing protein [Streptacidiphilus monticola]|uniref:DNA polymerase ligase N-terminal domain-containing protein n=1 Tax=Streptacidiphilus monticola TaxID=2161674 RepID=A0ABW1FXH4_9ACTN
MPATGTLAEYHRRRDFERTREPRGATPAASGGATPVFVVQIHDASTMHFDFRLEADGVLKSWAVPKGPSTDPHDKRFATPTEDHPLEYRSFEGRIPEGEYGAGSVIVWDEGTYRNLTTDRDGREVPFGRALEQGHVSFWLNGHKLHGGWALTRIRQEGRREAWLLVKEADRHARGGGTPSPQRARSALSGRTLRQMAGGAAEEGGR